MYEQLHLRVNEKKTEVCPVYDLATGNLRQDSIATKAIDTFKQRIRSIIRRVGGKVMTQITETMGNIFRAGSPTSGWRKHHGSSKSRTRGYAIDAGPSSSGSDAQG